MWRLGGWEIPLRFASYAGQGGSLGARRLGWMERLEALLQSLIFTG
jgi:hypothetical protein